MKIRFLLIMVLFACFFLAVLTDVHAAVSSVVINEIMTDNDTTYADSQGDYDDWIELLNTTGETVDVSGMYLSDNPDNFLKWQIPDSTQIQPNGYLIIWADEDGDDSLGLHANFKLSAGGEVVMLLDTDENGNALLDSVSFGDQETDQSYGRYPDGTGEWQTFVVPTPGQQNEIQSGVGSNSKVPEKFKLYPAYPNPFNPVTTIQFDLPVTQNVTLTIYNSLGRQVDNLIDQKLAAGFHTFEWNANNFSSGIYYYRLTGDQFQQTNKVLLLK